MTCAPQARYYTGRMANGVAWVRPLALGALLLVTTSAGAVETGSPPQLPPPPPPPVGANPGGAVPPGKGADKGSDQGSSDSTTPPASGGGGVHRVNTGSTSSSSSSSSSSSGLKTTGDSGSSSSPEGELDTRWAIAGMIGLSTDCMGFGLGVRGGKTLDNHLYLGGSAVYHFAGCGYSGYYYAPGVAYSTSASVFYLGPEAGYDFVLGPVVLRAYGGLGPAFLNASVSGPGVNQSSSDTRFVIWPGASVLWSIPDSPWFIGGDVRFVSVPNGPAVGFYFTGGIHFGE